MKLENSLRTILDREEQWLRGYSSIGSIFEHLKPVTFLMAKLLDDGFSKLGSGQCFSHVAWCLLLFD